MNTSFPDALPAGLTLHHGDYVLEDVLGQGGFGITYRARDATLHRTAAIKEFFPRGAQRDAGSNAVLSASPSQFEAAREQFLHEARALARFNHPHIVDVYSVFEENGTAYMAMEFVRGSTLAQRVEARGPLPAEEALPIIEQAGAALGEMHRGGLLHLDVNPDNVMTEESNARVVLLDFGLTKKIETASGYGTMRLDAWSRFGTPGFAAIEQYSDQNRTGVFTDIYGLAATLYFLLTGTAPPDAASRATGMSLPDVRSYNPQLSTSLAQTLEHALRLAPEERPQSVEEFLRALHEPAPAHGPQPAAEAEPLPVQVLPKQDPAPEYSAAEEFENLFGLPDPNPRAPAPRRRPYPPRDPFGDPMAGLRGPFSLMPFGFGCTSLGCSLGCFIFILVFLLIIASLLNSVGSVFIF